MLRNLRVSLAALIAAVQASLAFNPIHFGSYDLVPHGKYEAATTLSLAVQMDSRRTGAWDVPASLALEVSPRMELGAGLKTHWGESDDPVSYLVFGVKWKTLQNADFQVDLLVGADAARGKGFSLASLHRFRHFTRLHSQLTARIGFMDALVENDALMAFECGFYPALVPVRPLTLQLGMIASSQSSGFERHLAMDLQPALQVRYRRGSMVETAVALGLAGDRKEEMRVKVALIHGF